MTSRILSALEKMAEHDGETFAKFWDMFGAILKEGIYEDFERRSQLLKLARFRSTASGEATRSPLTTRHDEGRTIGDLLY